MTQLAGKTESRIVLCLLLLTDFTLQYSWFILLLGSMLQNLGELIVVKHSILDWSFSVHLINLL